MSALISGTFRAEDEDDCEDGFDHLLDDAIGTTSGRTSKFDIEDVVKAAKMVDATMVAERIAGWRKEDRAGNHAGGATPGISDRTILIVMLLLAREHAPLWGREMGNLLHRRLTPEARRFLDVPVTLSASQKRRIETRRWYNAAWNAFHRMTVTMDPYPDSKHYRLIKRAEREQVLAARDHDLVESRRVRLNWFSDAFLEMTFALQPREVRRLIRRRATIGVDQTPIRAASSRGHAPIDPDTGLERRVSKKTGKAYKDTLGVESEAGWYAKSTTARDGDGPGTTTSTEYIWGWAANIAVLVPTTRQDEPQFANIALSFSMSLPGQDIARETVQILQSIVDRGHTPGTVVADREYFANMKPETLHVPLKTMGWDFITDYQVTRLGIRGGKAGAIQVEGRHYCAGTPQDLLNASVQAAAHKIDEDTYRARLEERTAFELRPKERPDARGHVPMMCPAAGPNPTVECPLKALLKNAPDKIRPRVQDGDVPEAPPKICTQTSVDFDPEDGIRESQLHRYQSEEWSDGYKIGRNTDESYHAFVKDTGHEALDIPARRRIRGFAAQQVMATMLLAAGNIRKIIAFLTGREERTEKREAASLRAQGKVRKARRRRDREGHSNYKAKWPLKLLPGSAAGTEIDPPPRT
jgi:hypothetical protein